MGKLIFRPRTLAVTAAVPALALAFAVPAASAAKPVPRAKVADKARNAQRVDGISASKKPRPGHLLPLSHSGRFPASTLTSILSSSLIQRPLTRACPAGQFIRSVTRTGEVTCQAAGDITGVTAAPNGGLTGGGTSGDVELSIAPPLRFALGSTPALIDLENLGSGPAIIGESRLAAVQRLLPQRRHRRGQRAAGRQRVEQPGQRHDRLRPRGRGPRRCRPRSPTRPTTARRSTPAPPAPDGPSTPRCRTPTARPTPCSPARRAPIRTRSPGVFMGNVQIEGTSRSPGT